MDAIAYSDSLGADGATIRVSTRRQIKAQDVDDVRSFLSTLHGNDVGLFVSH
jgi:predicted Mrr-cat superfamily restriction endonuclease